MFYSELVLKAADIMYDAHKEDRDKGGYPYVFHPFYLASQMDDEETVCAALLHDVIEDHGDKYSFESLKEMGFGDKILDTLRLLIHDDDVPYMDYVRKIGTNPISRKVKTADLNHNLDSRRIGGAKPRKYDTYVDALNYLEGLE